MLAAALVLASGACRSPAHAQASATVLFAATEVASTSCAGASMDALATIEVARVLSGSVEARTLSASVLCADVASIEPATWLVGTLRGRGASLVLFGVAPAGPTDFATVAVRALLATPIAEVERTHTAIGGGRSQRWFAEGFGVVVDGTGTITDVLLPVPAGLGCDALPGLAGIAPGDAGPALRRAAGCSWPGLSDRHRFAPGLRAEAAGGYLTVGRRAEASSGR